MLSELLIPARLSKGSYHEILLVLLLETYGKGLGSGPVPLSRKPSPSGESTGWSFSTQILAALQAL